METGDTIFASLGVRSKIIAARALSIFDGIFGFCQIGGQPEKTQPIVRKKTSRNFEIFFVEFIAKELIYFDTIFQFFLFFILYNFFKTVSTRKNLAKKVIHIARS